MRFLLTYNGEDRTPTPEKMQEIRELRPGDGQVRRPARHRRHPAPGRQGRHGRRQVQPYRRAVPETKELVVGYAIVQVKSQAEAVEVARRFMSVAGNGTGEIRQLMGPADGPHH